MKQAWARVAPLGGAAWCVVALAACAGEPKQADTPGACPPGTVLRGTDCVPPEASGDQSGAAPAPSSSPTSATSQADLPAGPASPDTSNTVPYDKDAVEAELKRGARQVKDNCGAATGDDGEATGPWGAMDLQITLGRNGHIK